MCFNLDMCNSAQSSTDSHSHPPLTALKTHSYYFPLYITFPCPSPYSFTPTSLTPLLPLAPHMHHSFPRYAPLFSYFPYSTPGFLPLPSPPPSFLLCFIHSFQIGSCPLGENPSLFSPVVRLPLPAPSLAIHHSLPPPQSPSVCHSLRPTRCLPVTRARPLSPPTALCEFTLLLVICLACFVHQPFS